MSKQESSSRKSLWFHLWSEWIKPLSITLFVLMSFRSAVADWNDVPTGSMKPTILEGDRIMVNKLAYDLRIPFTQVRLARWDAPKVGEVIVFLSPQDGTRLVKRVVGVEGDRIEIRRGQLYRNGERVLLEVPEDVLTQTWAQQVGTSAQFHWEGLPGHRHPIMKQTWRSRREFHQEIVVPDNHVFVLGDNRTNSADSRVFGFVNRELIQGKAWAVAGSWNSQEMNFRWSRFFQSLP